MFVGPHTSYAILIAGNFVQGLGMGLSMMPCMTAAMQSVPPTAIARTSTAMNIIRQGGASIGTAVLTVVLATGITHNLKSALGAHAPRSSGGLGSLQSLPGSEHAAVAAPIAHAFGTTFVWALALVAIAVVPALALALMGRGATASGA
jgi:MFS family permease